VCVDSWGKVLGNGRRRRRLRFNFCAAGKGCDFGRTESVPQMGAYVYDDADASFR
jgi:hypothetical protein